MEHDEYTLARVGEPCGAKQPWFITHALCRCGGARYGLQNAFRWIEIHEITCQAKER